MRNRWAERCAVLAVRRARELVPATRAHTELPQVVEGAVAPVEAAEDHETALDLAPVPIRVRDGSMRRSSRRILPSEPFELAIARL